MWDQWLLKRVGDGSWTSRRCSWNVIMTVEVRGWYNRRSVGFEAKFRVCNSNNCTKQHCVTEALFRASCHVYPYLDNTLGSKRPIHFMEPDWLVSGMTGWLVSGMTDSYEAYSSDHTMKLYWHDGAIRDTQMVLIMLVRSCSLKKACFYVYHLFLLQYCERLVRVP
jgi:hypothetical protein